LRPNPLLTNRGRVAILGLETKNTKIVSRVGKAGAMKKDQKIRGRILGMARVRFLKFGFSKVTMDEIAGQLGMSKKTIYEYFPSKDQLLRALVKSLLRAIADRVDRIVHSRQLDFMDKLGELLAFMGIQISELGQALIPDLERSAPEVWKEIDEFRRKKILANFGKLFAEGVRKGVFRSDLNPELLVMMYANTIQSTLNPATLSRLPLSAADIFDAIIKVFFEGMLTERGRARYYKSGLISIQKRRGGI